MNSFLRQLSKEELIGILGQSPFFLSQVIAKADLTKIYEGWFHKGLNATIVRNYGAKLIVTSPISGKRCIIQHVGFWIDIEDYGSEIVNVAIFGNALKAPKVIIRTESACPPSFLFGSQRCNCWDQWVTARELGANYHKIKQPSCNTAKQLEEYIKNYEPNPAPPALILVYLDSQSGMGSGVLPNSYNSSICETAFMRHRGEYTAEQLFDASMAESFEMIGIDPDLRSSRNGLGYKIPGVVLDCMGINKKIHLLTNNPSKEKALTSMGYLVKRHYINGRFDITCEIETHDRMKEFGHLIECESDINPASEVVRLIGEIDDGRYE